jgi:hypothetical protein
LPYNWNGTNYSAAGSYTITTANAAGCDSVATLNLTIKSPTTSTTNVAVCSNQLPYNWNGTNYSAAGSYTFTTTNAAGCDSVATLNLTIKSPTTSTTNVAICANQVPYNWNGTNYSAGGSYTFTTTNAAGCDSVATLNLTIKSRPHQQQMLRHVLINCLIIGTELTIVLLDHTPSPQPMQQDVIRLRR